jgi:glycosyltransferase involved in cell wall biosynthesis
LRNNLALDDDTFLFGCVAQLVPWKNQEAFIDAAAQICQEEGCVNARFALSVATYGAIIAITWRNYARA